MTVQSSQFVPFPYSSPRLALSFTSTCHLESNGGTDLCDGYTAPGGEGLNVRCKQAKRWQNTVGRPDVPGFFGALTGRRATKGVFITTSTYSREAMEFAEAVSDKIVLVDGARLTELMMDFGVGVSRKAIWVPRVDSDYFDEA